MNTDPSTPAPSYEYATPPQQRSSWPTLFGVIAIVFGALGLILAAVGIISSLMMPKFMGMTGAASASDPEAQKMIDAMTANMEKWTGINLVLTACLLLLAIMLLVGGIFLVMRKPLAPKLLIPWAYGKIVIGIGGALVGMQMQNGQMSSMMNSAGTSGMPSGATTAITALYGAMFIFQVIWLCALPVTMLIWLNRTVIKADIATWQNGDSTGAGLDGTPIA